MMLESSQRLAASLIETGAPDDSRRRMLGVGVDPGVVQDVMDAGSTGSVNVIVNTELVGTAIAP
jgi:hypothetical protein